MKITQDMLLTRLELALTSLSEMRLYQLGYSSLEYLGQDSNLQQYGSKPYASTNWATQAYTGSQTRTGTIRILSPLSLPIGLYQLIPSGGYRTRTCIGVTLDSLANCSNDHYGNPPEMGDRGLEPLKSVGTTILQTVAVAAVPITHRQGTVGIEPTPLGATIQGSTTKLCTPKQVGRFELPASSLEERHSRPLNYTCQRPLGGLEPPTFNLQKCCSSQLSYRGGMHKMRLELMIFHISGGCICHYATCAIAPARVELAPSIYKMDALNHMSFRALTEGTGIEPVTVLPATVFRTASSTNRTPSIDKYNTHCIDIIAVLYDLLQYYDITGFTSIIKNPCHMATDMLYLPYGNFERSMHDGRRSSTTSQRARMEPSQAETQGERIPLCSKVDARRKVYCTDRQIRATYSRSSARETSRQKIKPAWRLATIKNSAAFRFLTNAWKTEVKNPRYSRATFSITACPKTSQWLYKRWVCERKAIPMRPTKWYPVISTSNSDLAKPYQNNLADMDNFSFLRKEIAMPDKPQKTYYEIIRHRRGLLLYDPIQKKYVPNRRGRPKHFPLVKHVQQYLQKRGVA